MNFILGQKVVFSLLKRVKFGSAVSMVRTAGPELYLAGGIGLGVFAAVSLARAHKRENETYDDLKEGLKYTLNEIDMSELENTEEDTPYYSDADKVKAIAPYLMQMGMELAKQYGPSVVLGTASILLVTNGHKILKNRNKGLLAAFGAVQAALMEYRTRVEAEVGPEVEQRLWYNLEERETTVLEINPDTGKATKRKVKANHASEMLSPSLYTRQFNHLNPNWKSDPELRRWYLQVVETQLTDRLNLWGWVSLNDAYSSLGMKPSPEGQVVGWALRSGGDTFVDFGLDKPVNVDAKKTGVYILDFNVNGPILDYIRKEG